MEGREVNVIRAEATKTILDTRDDCGSVEALGAAPDPGETARRARDLGADLDLVPGVAYNVSWYGVGKRGPWG